MAEYVFIAFEALSHKSNFTILGLFKSHAAAVTCCQKYAGIAGVAVPDAIDEHQTLFKIEEWPVLSRLRRA